MSGPVFKRIQILKMIPSFPSRISTSKIFERLENEGFKLNKRTIQRDLKDLAKLFDTENDGNNESPPNYLKINNPVKFTPLIVKGT